MITEYFSALLPLVLTASLQTAQPVGPSQGSAGQQQENCPIRIDKVGLGGAFGTVRVYFTNTSPQPVSAVIFHSTRVDALGDEVKPDERTNLGGLEQGGDRSEQTFTSKKGLAPNTSQVMEDNMVLYGRPQKGSHQHVYLRGVKFVDASVWKDSGSHSCGWMAK
jgi:hypothetical protein